MCVCVCVFVCVCVCVRVCVVVCVERESLCVSMVVVQVGSVYQERILREKEDTLRALNAKMKTDSSSARQ